MTDRTATRPDLLTDEATRPHRRATSFVAVAHGAAPQCRIRLLGELDQATAPALQTLLEHVRAADRVLIELDLGGVTFLSAAGLRVFNEADEAFREAGGSMVLTRPSDLARRLLRATGLDTRLSIDPPTPRLHGPVSPLCPSHSQVEQRPFPVRTPDHIGARGANS